MAGINYVNNGSRKIKFKNVGKLYRWSKPDAIAKVEIDSRISAILYIDFSLASEKDGGII